MPEIATISAYGVILFNICSRRNAALNLRPDPLHAITSIARELACIISMKPEHITQFAR
jgi:hypothetical protein